MLLSKKETKTILQTIEYIKAFEDRRLSKKLLLDVDIESVNSALNIMDIFHNSIYTKEDIDNMLHDMPIASAKELDIDGFDIKKTFKLEDSPKVKKYLDIALDAVLGGLTQNKKAKLIKYLKGYKMDE